MTRALIVCSLLGAALHAETTVVPSPVDARKPAADSTIRIEKADGSLIATGVIAERGGYFLSKASELPDLAKVVCRLPDGSQAKAREIRRNTRLDLVLGQIAGGADLKAVTWNESKSLSLGQWLLAPKQGAREMRLGVVSARRREIKGSNAAMGIRMSNQTRESGAKIISVAEDSPAAVAGLKEDDVLVAIAGDVVKEYRAVHDLIRSREPGEELEIQYRRGGKLSKCIVRLASQNRLLLNWEGEDYANGGISIRTDNFPEVIQHDIPLGPADMGGALFDLLGHAVGINIARVDRVTTFALPMEVFWPVVQQWIREDRQPPKALPK